MLSKNLASLHEAKTMATKIWRRNNNGKSIAAKTEVSAIREDQLSNFTMEALLNVINQKSNQTWGEGNGNNQAQQNKEEQEEEL